MRGGTRITDEHDWKQLFKENPLNRVKHFS
jgi:hypothetical protein